MVRILSLALLTTAALVVGCQSSDFWHLGGSPSGATTVPTSPFGTPGPATSQISNMAKAPVAAAETMIVVDNVGKKLIAANPSLGMKPVFTTIGTDHAEIFHQGTGAIFITEGLVRQCKTEGQLAAVLSLEMGKMVSEREALASPPKRDTARQGPIVMTMGNSGQFSGLDQLQQAEAANLGAEQRKAAAKKLIPPDPDTLARGYLEAAGFKRTDLDAVAPQLDQADKNYIIEKQLKGASGAPAWTPN